MHRYATWLLIFLAGWGLSRITYQYLDGAQRKPVQTVFSAPKKNINHRQSASAHKAASSGRADEMAGLLQRNEFEEVVEYFESVQDRDDELTAENIRQQILGHARLLVTAQRFSMAEQLLLRFLLAAYRDVEAGLLLADVYLGKEDFIAAIEQCYEVRGYAYRAHMLQRINVCIRSTVTELADTLKAKGDQNALLALYQYLTQQEPDYGPWFIGLAAAQLALEDTEAGRRSLLLVSQDPDVGAQARAMLAELTAARGAANGTAPQAASAEVVGIPLYRSGNHFIVDARQDYGQNLRLLIDTGASLTMLRPGVLEQAGLRFQETGRSGAFNTANGQIQVPVYKLDSLTVGDWQVRQLEIGVLDSSAGPDIDGLLGMNFLRHFQFFIDQNEAVLRLTVNH